MKDAEMIHCPRCSRLFSSESGHSYCSVCYAQAERDEDIVEDAILFYGKASDKEIANFTHLSLERVQSILEASKVFSSGRESDALCKKCGKRKAMLDAKNCLLCQLTMYKSLGDEVQLLGESIANRPNQPRVSLHDVLMDKRSRTAHNRFNPVSRSIKGGR